MRFFDVGENLLDVIKHVWMSILLLLVSMERASSAIYLLTSSLVLHVGRFFLRNLCARVLLSCDGSCRAISLVTYGSKDSMGFVNSPDSGLGNACDILWPQNSLMNLLTHC